MKVKPIFKFVLSAFVTAAVLFIFSALVGKYYHKIYLKEKSDTKLRVEFINHTDEAVQLFDIMFDGHLIKDKRLYNETVHSDDIVISDRLYLQEKNNRPIYDDYSFHEYEFYDDYDSAEIITFVLKRNNKQKEYRFALNRYKGKQCYYRFDIYSDRVEVKDCDK